MADRNPCACDTVVVVYALAESQHSVEIPFAPGMTAADAIERSGLTATFAEISERPLVLGLFGRRIEPQRLIGAGDRIEICRPLSRDPRELRRYMTEQGMVIGQRGIAVPPDVGSAEDTSEKPR